MCSYSDSEQESDLMAAVGQLSQRLARQREELDQLRAEQQAMFQSLQQKLDAMTSAIASAQRSSLAEHAREQRIFTKLQDVQCFLGRGRKGRGLEGEGGEGRRGRKNVEGDVEEGGEEYISQRRSPFQFKTRDIS